MSPYPLSLIHHQNATCGVSCGSIPLGRMPDTTPGAAAPIFKIGLPCIRHPAGGQEISEKKQKSNGYEIRR